MGWVGWGWLSFVGDKPTEPLLICWCLKFVPRIRAKTWFILLQVQTQLRECSFLFSWIILTRHDHGSKPQSRPHRVTSGQKRNRVKCEYDHTYFETSNLGSFKSQPPRWLGIKSGLWWLCVIIWQLYWKPPRPLWERKEEMTLWCCLRNYG